MSELDPQARPDPALDALLGDVAWAVDEDLARTQAAWDFAAVVARAHELDPQLVPTEIVQEVEGAAPVVSLAQQRRARRATRDDPDLEGILASVRATIEHDAVLRRHGLTAPQPVVAPSGRRMVLAAALLAAALVIAFGLMQGVRYVQLSREAPNDAALHLGEAGEPESQEATFATPEPRPSPRAATTPRAAAPMPAIAPPTAESPEPAPPPVASPRTKAKKSSEPIERAPSLSDRLAELDAAAAAALRARDLDTAAQKFEEIVELGGTSRLADLAYGELFHLAHRRGDTAGEAALWQRYLLRFPEGRFADDARAGLCRRASSDTKDACWREYLADFPKGSYVRQAEQHLGGKAP